MLDNVKSGHTITLLDTKNDWHYIELTNGTKAWVASWLTDQPVETEKNTKEKDKKQSSSSNSSNGTLKGQTIMLDPSSGCKYPVSIFIDGVTIYVLTT